MANHEPRAQRLRRERTTRSAEREKLARCIIPIANRSKRASRADSAYVLTHQEHWELKDWALTKYTERQAKREQDHLKRNKRKNNELHPHPKRPVYSPEELKRRNVLLSLPDKKPDSMSWDLWKGLLKERKKLFTHTNPPLRGIPDYSRKTAPARKKPTRYQEAYILSDKLISEGALASLVANGKASYEQYQYINTPAGTGNTMICAYRKILGIKRIPHFD